MKGQDKFVLVFFAPGQGGERMSEEAQEIIRYYGAFIETAVSDKEVSNRKQEEVRSCQQHLN